MQTPGTTMAYMVGAATAAITADPGFTAALAAAVSSIIGGNHLQTDGNNEREINGEGIGDKVHVYYNSWIVCEISDLFSENK